MAHYTQKFKQIRFSRKLYSLHFVKIRHFYSSLARTFRQFFSTEHESLKSNDSHYKEGKKRKNWPIPGVKMSIKQTTRGFTYPATTDRMNTSQRSQVELIKSKASLIAIYFFCFPRIKETAYKALVRPTVEYCTTGNKDLGSLHKGCFPLR